MSALTPTSTLALAPASVHPTPVDAVPSRVLRVQVAGHTLALDMECVRELRGATPIQPLPGARDSVLGLLELRGEVLPVLDLGRLLGEAAAPADAPLVVLTWPPAATAGAATASPSGGARAVGALRVQALDAVMDVDAAQWRASPWPTGSVRHLALTADGPLPLVDLRRLLADALPPSASY